MASISLFTLPLSLPESQCVKAPNTVAAKLCQRLSSKHRWCVTGTFINFLSLLAPCLVLLVSCPGTPCSSDGIHYLCGQLAALRASPYCLPAIFNSRCITPFRRGRTSNDGFGFFLVRLRVCKFVCS